MCDRKFTSKDSFDRNNGQLEFRKNVCYLQHFCKRKLCKLNLNPPQKQMNFWIFSKNRQIQRLLIEKHPVLTNRLHSNSYYNLNDTDIHIYTRASIGHSSRRCAFVPSYHLSLPSSSSSHVCRMLFYTHARKWAAKKQNTAVAVCLSHCQTIEPLLVIDTYILQRRRNTIIPFFFVHFRIDIENKLAVCVISNKTVKERL